MSTIREPHSMKGLHFSVEQRRRYLLLALAPGDHARQCALASLPLFEVALRGGDAVHRPKRKEVAR